MFSLVSTKALWFTECLLCTVTALARCWGHISSPFSLSTVRSHLLLSAWDVVLKEAQGGPERISPASGLQRLSRELLALASLPSPPLLTPKGCSMLQRPWENPSL